MGKINTSSVLTQPPAPQKKYLEGEAPAASRPSPQQRTANDEISLQHPVYYTQGTVQLPGVTVKADGGAGEFSIEEIGKHENPV